ncbi:hypothetical protein PO124_23010 [Bacillus licheniformis]|nr:hypothetical protein [Bacillus licheniformis]
MKGRHSESVRGEAAWNICRYDRKGEDREKFRALMKELNEPVPDSEIVDNQDDALRLRSQSVSDYRAAGLYTGRKGGGIAATKRSFCL